MPKTPLFTNVDCISMYVDDIDCGLRFYQDALGLQLLWRTEGSCGLGMPNGVAEVVLVTAHNPMVDLKVE
ncbi:MAG: VOC family protein, partial [Eubacteriales bacterium]|nr:VOC family protein [Eubacteriales bacterium]